MKVERINRVLLFVQYPWLKPYIEFNTDMLKGPKILSKKICSNYLTMLFLEKQWRMSEKTKGRISIQVPTKKN